MIKKRYWAAYSNFNMRASDQDNDLEKLRRRVRAKMQYPQDNYEIFKNGPGFHSTTQKEFFVEHYNDAYWEAQGVPSVRL